MGSKRGTIVGVALVAYVVAFWTVVAIACGDKVKTTAASVAATVSGVASCAGMMDSPCVLDGATARTAMKLCTDRALASIHGAGGAAGSDCSIEAGLCGTLESAFASKSWSCLGGDVQALATACERACADQEIDGRVVVAQPGVSLGQVTRCPVSGVAFTVRDDSPRVELHDGEYVTCCGACAQILRKHPERFIET